MAHIHDLIDFTVAVFIVHDNKVLLILHKKLLRWLPIGGHIELNEDPDQGLLREIKEECGLEVDILSTKPNLECAGTKFLYTPNYMDLHDISDTHKHVGLTYFAQAKSDKFTFAEKEHNDIRWVTEEELEDEKLNLSTAIQFYVKEALKASQIHEV
ncbi:MAG: NUDIX domain-containing protein [bacterium]|nr:NUDIX domain-containing protein [bacterium]